jgi:hypothetical protein
MLQAQSILSRTGTLSWIQDEYLLHLQSANNVPLDVISSHYANSSQTAVLEVTEVATGLLRSSILIKETFDDLTPIRVVSSSEFMVLYHPSTGEHRVHTLGGTFIGSVNKPLLNGTRILTACKPKLANGVFLFACEDDSLYALLIKKPKSNSLSAVGDNLILSPSFRLDKADDYKLEKHKEKISKLISHPLLPIVFVVFAASHVQVRPCMAMTSSSLALTCCINRYGRMRSFIVY